MNRTQSESSLSLVEDSLTCPLCGDAGITTTIQPHSFDYGTGKSKAELTVDAHVRRCSSCDFDYLDDVTENLKQEAVCRYLGVLSPNEIRNIRKDCGMSRSKFAHVTGLGEASLNRWENSLNIQSLAYDRYLRLLAIPGTIRDLERIVSNTTLPKDQVKLGNRFRSLVVDEHLLEKKKKFQLHRVA